MTDSKVEVSNEALNLIGAASILSFDEQTHTARRCAAIYDTTRQALLRMHPWSCARKRVQLAPVVTHPHFDYAHAFALPRDFIRLESAGTTDFEVESRHILANTSLINLIYTFDNDNEQTWDSLFREAMVYYLASKLAKATTGSNAEGDSCWQKLQQTLKQARAINAQERPSQDFSVNFSSSLIEVRY